MQSRMYAFAQAGLDRADRLREDPPALAALWAKAAVLVIDEQGAAFAQADSQPLLVEGASLGGGPGTAIFLGLQGERAWFAVRAEVIALQSSHRVDLRRAAAIWPALASGSFALARALLHWQTHARFCGSCGGAVQFRRAGYLGVCDSCEREHYPRVDPAVIVSVSDGERLLLGRQASWPPRRWSVLAGFVEPGETLEQTVAREVLEESQVRVRSSGYAGAQPWPFPGSLMLGFEAHAEPDPPKVNGELEAARWFTVEEIGRARQRRDDDMGSDILLAPPISIARWLIERWYLSRCGS